MVAFSTTSSMQQQSFITLERATSIVLSYMFSGAVGQGKGVSYSLLEESESYFCFMAALEDGNQLGEPIDRHRVVVGRESGEIQSLELISLPTPDLANAVFSATGHHLATSERFTDGALSISYRVSVQEDPDIEYVVQLRHHGDVASMNAVMQLVSSTIDPSILPVPAVYPIAGERQRQQKHGMGVQITRFIPGVMGNISYPCMTHGERLAFVRKLALAFDALWRIPLPAERLIGELRATANSSQIDLSVGPDRHYSLGGPFSSVADYLRARIRAALDALQKQQGIEEYKSRYLQRITSFVETGMLDIPALVEQIPVVITHSDMGPHNVIVSSTNPADVVAIIDWEFCAIAPYASLEPVIEKLFRKPAANGFGDEYPCADELRRSFWDAIPEWQRWNKCEAATVFREWFRFASFMKAEWRPDSLDNDEKERFWAENVRVVEGFLVKHHLVGCSQNDCF